MYFSIVSILGDAFALTSTYPPNIMTTSGLVAIHPLTLVPNYCAGTNIYIWNEKADAKVKLLSSEQMVTESTFSFLLANSSQKVFVDESTYASYKAYLIENLEAWLTETRVPSILKTAVISEYLHCQFKIGFESKSIRRMLDISAECCRHLGQLGHHVGMNGRELQRVLRHDASFVTHAVNTALYVFLIAQNIGYAREMISEVCVGAMMHDIGKIEPGLLNGTCEVGTTNSSEWTLRVAQSHPLEGFRRLCHEPGVTESQLLMAYQHHEKLDGKGYPVGLLSNEIHEASKLCAVANRYDGLTSERPGRHALTRMAAFRIIESEKNTALDSEIIKCLEATMSQASTS